MFYSYSLIFIGYLLLALKVFNLFILQIVGLFGYGCIAVGLFKLERNRNTKIALLAVIGLFLLTGSTFVRKPVLDPQTLDIVIAVIETVAYLILNCVLINYLMEDVYLKLNTRKLINEANLCKKNKTKFMNLVVYSMLCQNGVFMFPKLGAILFLVGIGLAIYLSIIQVIYYFNISKLLKN